MREFNSSFIKWVGGKYRSLCELMPRFPEACSTYFEPFLGSGVVFFNLPERFYDNAILADTEVSLIRTFREVRNQPDLLISLLEGLSYNKSCYYECRSEFNALLTAHRSSVYGYDGARMAALFIYLNRCGFNGLYRLNKSGEFNVPMGAYKGNPHHCFNTIRECSKRLGGVELYSCDYVSMLGLAQSGDFVYLDPPYYPENANSFVGYNVEEFREEQHVELAKSVKTLADRGALFLLSNANMPEVRKLYKDFRLRTVYTTRSVSAGSNRGMYGELLVSNY